jgi:hypothetical protein
LLKEYGKSFYGERTKEVKMKRNKTPYQRATAGILLLIALLFGFDASPAGKNPCSEDIAKFCGDTGPGRTALLECLEAHETHLSDACKSYEGELGEAREETREEIVQQIKILQTCRDDIAKLCKDVKPGVFGIATCLKEHTKELSPSCLEAVNAARGPEEGKKIK